MIPEDIKGLLQELVQAIIMVQKSGEVLTDDFQLQLAQTLENLVSHLDEASTSQAEQTPTQQEISPRISNDARLLWVLAGSNSENFVSYLHTYPTRETKELLANPAALEQIINQLSKDIPKRESAVIDGVPESPIQSSNIWGAAYNPRTHRMLVRFQGGSEYEYDGIPASIFEAFISGAAAARTKGRNRYGAWWVGKNPSLGAAMHRYIREGGFPYRRVV